MINYVLKIVSLFNKELLALIKDPSSRALLFVPAFVQSLLFGYAGTFDLNDVPYAVLDRSGGYAAHELLSDIDGSGAFERVVTLTSSSQIGDVVESEKALLVIVIPSNFENLLNSNQQAPLQVILDGRNSSTASYAAAYISSIVGSYNLSRGNISSVTMMQRSWFNYNLESRWNLMPAMIASLSMLQTLMLAAFSVAREREQGTFDQLLVTPLTPFQILIGKALPAIFVGLVQSSIVFMIILFWFKIPMNGSVPLLYLGLLSFTVASVGIGLSISAISLSMQQAMLYTFMFIMPLMLLSGLITPIKNMPEFLQMVTYINPLRFGIDIVRRVYLEGAVFSDIAFDFVPELAIAAVTLPVAAFLFRNRLS